MHHIELRGVLALDFVKYIKHTHTQNTHNMYTCIALIAALSYILKM